MPESLLQKDDLERWKQLIHSYAKDKGYGEIQILSDVGSGLNENRKGFLRLLGMVAEGKVSRTIIVYEDGLTRFGFGTLGEDVPGFWSCDRGGKQRGEDSSGGAC